MGNESGDQGGEEAGDIVWEDVGEEEDRRFGGDETQVSTTSIL